MSLIFLSTLICKITFLSTLPTTKTFMPKWAPHEWTQPLAGESSPLMGALLIVINVSEIDYFGQRFGSNKRARPVGTKHLKPHQR